MVLLENAPVFRRIQDDDPLRYQQLIRLAHSSNTDTSKVRELFNGNSTEEQRKLVAKEICDEVDVVDPSRLMTLISQALKWQRHVGLLPNSTRIDLLKNTAAGRDELMIDEIISRNDKTIKFGKTTEADCVKFSSDGKYLVSGSSDGFIEIWDFETGQLRTDLQYQANDALMMHSDAVLCLDFSNDGEFLASGSQGGEVKVWKIVTGKCVKRLKNCHTSGVGQLHFSMNGLEILTCGAGTAEDVFKLQGLVSGRALKEFRGHKAQCTQAKFCKEDKLIISASSDGEIRIWDSGTSECISRFYASQSSPESISGQRLGGIVELIVPNSLQRSGATGVQADSVMVISQDFFLRDFFFNGKLHFEVNIADQVASFESGASSLTQRSSKSCDAVGGALSARGKLLYCCSEGGVLYCVDIESRRVLRALQAHPSNLKGAAHHPHHNILATFSSDHSLKVWTSN
eukprot:TRINITY_DN19655_c0_g1_i1.p1 TRINITY_DN19655_c0_g1~~TRINITY_DN19655_c0_g1_i1.p1  ORF type:complete len:458 (-),score=125.09 TRINITY_DN19655_c0_g1_i1:42-1415(-)